MSYAQQIIADSYFSLPSAGHSLGAKCSPLGILRGALVHRSSNCCQRVYRVGIPPLANTHSSQLTMSLTFSDPLLTRIRQLDEDVRLIVYENPDPWWKKVPAMQTIMVSLTKSLPYPIGCLSCFSKDTGHKYIHQFLSSDNETADLGEYLENAYNWYLLPVNQRRSAESLQIHFEGTPAWLDRDQGVQRAMSNVLQLQFAQTHVFALHPPPLQSMGSGLPQDADLNIAEDEGELLLSARSCVYSHTLPSIASPSPDPSETPRPPRRSQRSTRLVVLSDGSGEDKGELVVLAR